MQRLARIAKRSGEARRLEDNRVSARCELRLADQQEGFDAFTVLHESGGAGGKPLPDNL